MDELRSELFINGEDEMLQFGGQLAGGCSMGAIIYLHGQLGAGKTTLVRGLLRHMGHEGPVRSPTYSIVEHYRFQDQFVYHFDLYRLGDPEELEFMGIRDYFRQQNICLVEWAENGSGILPRADLIIKIHYQDAGQRRLHIEPVSQRGRDIYLIIEPHFGLYSASS